MTLVSETNSPSRAVKVAVPVMVNGMLDRVDTVQGRAYIDWLGSDREVFFPPALAPAVADLSGRSVAAKGLGEFDDKDRLIRIDLESILAEPEIVDERVVPPFDPETIPRANHDFDVDEFLREIYDARRGEVCQCQGK